MKAAVPPINGAEPSSVVPSKKETVPSGTPEAPATVAVNSVSSPYVHGLVGLVSVVVVELSARPDGGGGELAGL